MMFNLERPAGDQVIREPDGGRYVLHVHRSEEVWTWACAVAVAAELRRDLQQRARTRLLLSDGTVPAPVYDALARAPLDWHRVDIALLDERWLQPDDPDSHAWRVRRQVLHHHAAGARFETLTGPGRTIEESVAMANAHGSQPGSMAVLTMGNDGHIASLFPRMVDLGRALATREAYASVDAEGCPSAARWTRRITITPAGLARARTRILLMRGKAAREAFGYAVASGKVESWPVLAAMDGSTPLHVHWCA